MINNLQRALTDLIPARDFAGCYIAIERAMMTLHNRLKAANAVINKAATARRAAGRAKGTAERARRKYTSIKRAAPFTARKAKVRAERAETATRTASEAAAETAAAIDFKCLRLAGRCGQDNTAAGYLRAFIARRAFLQNPKTIAELSAYDPPPGLRKIEDIYASEARYAELNDKRRRGELNDAELIELTRLEARLGDLFRDVVPLIIGLEPEIALSTQGEGKK